MPNLLIVAPTNNGKTMLMQKFFRERFPQRAKGEQDLLLESPVICMQISSSPDLKRFYSALLEILDACHGRTKTTFASFQPEVYRKMK